MQGNLRADGESNPVLLKTELHGGIAIFLAVAYIVVVEPAVLSGAALGVSTGIPAGAAFTATCLAAAAACFIMGWIGRLPIAAAPYMGENFFFVTALIPAAAAAGYAEPWRAALAVTLLSGLLLLAVSATGLRTILARGIPATLIQAIRGGIGLFITFLGLKAAGVVVQNPGTWVGFTPHPTSPDVWVTLAGLTATVALLARGRSIALLAGIGITFALGAAVHQILPRFAPDLVQSAAIQSSATLKSLQLPSALASLPPSPRPLLLGLDWRALLDPRLYSGALVLFLMILFDATGTLLAVVASTGSPANPSTGANDPRFRRGLLADAWGSVLAPLFGTSSVGAYMESAVGARIGARSGVAAMVVGLLFLLALPLAPLATSLGSYPPATAPALIVVGAWIVAGVREIAWDDPTEAIPALATVAGIPLTFSIAHGIALGFVLWPLMKLAAGRTRDIHGVAWVLGALAGISLLTG